MEVRVDTFVERLDGTRELVNTCYMVLVALDENQKPVPVPQLICETQQEKEEFENGPAGSSSGKPGGTRDINL